MEPRLAAPLLKKFFNDMTPKLLSDYFTIFVYHRRKQNKVRQNVGRRERKNSGCGQAPILLS